MNRSLVLTPLLLATIAGTSSFAGPGQDPEPKFTDRFLVDSRDWASSGSTTYMILEPGWQLVLEGKEKGKAGKLTITVLAETKTIDGVETRVIEERETEDDELVEISRNYFAISKKTSSIYYFGEDVDMYKNGKVEGHEGSWHSGEGGARFGLMMPGTPLLGSRYHQEVAPGSAMDRAQIVSLEDKIETPAGKFVDCLDVEETTPLEKGEKAHKIFAPGIGLVREGHLKLAKYGKIK